MLKRRINASRDCLLAHCLNPGCLVCAGWPNTSCWPISEANEPPYTARNQGIFASESSREGVAGYLAFRGPMQPEIAFKALSLFLIVYLGLTCVVLSLVSMRKENRLGWPLRGVIWFSLAIVGSCVLIGLVAGYVQNARSLEKNPHRVKTTMTQ